MKEKKDIKDAKVEKNVMKEKESVNEVKTPVDEVAGEIAEEAKDTRLESIKAELEEKSKKCDEYLDKYQRSVAEFDNFKKRTAREKEALYSEAVCDVTASILSVVDNLDRAVQACSKENDFQMLKDGVELVYRQLKDALKKMGIEEISCDNACFDPLLHNAVMHVEDENYGQNCVIEEFQKGYVYKDKVIRHSMVKVAN